MNDRTDQQLLRDYAPLILKRPFGELVRRHVNLMHAAAVRMVRDPHLAEDVILRYFDGKSARGIGARLGLSEDAAQKRVSRALDRLRGFFVERGRAVTTLTAGGAITLEAVQAAPIGLGKAARRRPTVADRDRSTSSRPSRAHRSHSG